MKKKLCVANSVALALTILINYLSNTGVFNGASMKEISDRYHNYFTPDTYAFSIWGLIYVGLTVFVVYSFSKKYNTDFVLKIGWWFVISCITNSAWVILWLNDFTGVSVIVILTLFYSLYKIITNLHINISEVPDKQITYVNFPFSIYAGWITVAAIANIAAFLTKINWINDGSSGFTFTIVMLNLAGLINVLIIWKRNMYAFSFVGIWALLAIAKSNWYGNQVIVFTAIIVSMIIFVSMILHLFLHRKETPINSSAVYK